MRSALLSSFMVSRAWYRVVPFALLHGLTACVGELGGDVPEFANLPRCEVPVSISVVSKVGTESIAVLRASGGTRRYAWSIARDEQATGSRIDQATGVFVAGTKPGVVTIEVRDLGCAGRAEFDIEVDDRFALEPSTVEIAPLGGFVFRVRGGMDDVRFELVQNGSGGSIDSVSGAYRAGAAEGEDRVRARRSSAGESAEAIVRVKNDAGVRAAVDQLVIPIGSRYEVSATGGSGYYDLSLADDALRLEGRTLIAQRAGASALRIVDRYTEARTDVRLITTQSIDAPRTIGGDREASNRALSADLDGDGDLDLLLGLARSNVSGSMAGALFVYENEGNRLSSAPVRTLSGAFREDLFAYSFAVGDLDGDGLLELAVGSLYSDLGTINSGAVYLWRGTRGTFFEGNPVVHAGLTAHQAFGAAVALCDFDGDGDDDLAVGASGGENLAAMPIMYDEGAVYLYRSERGELPENADQVLYPRIPDGAGSFGSFSGAQYGVTFGAGDIDGDGRCDLAVHGLRGTPSTNYDGVVFVHRGRAASDGVEGGLVPTPSLVIAASETPDASSAFGRAIAIGDLNGDGKGELVLGHAGSDNGVYGPDVGAVRIFLGRTLDADASRLMLPSDSDWMYEPSLYQSYAGTSVALFDSNGDGLLDLIVGEPRDERAPGGERTGSVKVFEGVRGSLPNTTTPAQRAAGLRSEDWFGMSIAALGDLDADGRSELVSYANYDDRSGPEAGTLYLVRQGRPLEPIEFTRAPGPSGFGAAMTFLRDIDGDGLPDLAVGAPRQSGLTRPDGSTLGVQHGAVFLYRGTANGFSLSPDLTFAGFQDGSDSQLGTTVSAGDFDGDGIEDLIATASASLAPSYDPMRYVVDPSCSSQGLGGVGAIYVFRGRPNGLPARDPSFIVFGSQSYAGIPVAISGFDFDGDRRDDVAFGTSNWTNTAGEIVGSVWLVRGRLPDPSGLTTITCATELLGVGAQAGAALGASLSPVGDLDGDGCEEVAAGALSQDSPSGVLDVGGAYVFFGSGGASCPSSATVRLTGDDPYSYAGASIGGGGDLNGDGVVDLVVGAPYLNNAEGQVGRMFVLSGAALRDAKSAAGALSLRSTSLAILDGTDAGERAGMSVGIVPALGPGGSAALVYGSPLSSFSGTPSSGALFIYGWSGSGRSERPLAVFAGETLGEAPHLGSAFAAHVDETGARFAVGAPFGNARTPSNGTAYVAHVLRAD